VLAPGTTDRHIKLVTKKEEEEEKEEKKKTLTCQGWLTFPL
jgi:hypothetical protein